ncbi:hypothetical protein Trihar35433_2745 [Trichoderma harzianum]|nr:hypothetical protein Trihar35433_2745 [Trichoderma harzianum]
MAQKLSEERDESFDGEQREALLHQGQFSSDAGRQRRASSRRTFLTHMVTVILTSVTWIALILLYRPDNIFDSPNKSGNSTVLPGFDYISCGNSTETAKAMGCVYDILANHWVPAQCEDKQAIEEYQKDGTWYGYADAEHKKLLPYAEMGEVGMYWTNLRDHVNHCARLWTKQFNAFMEDRDYYDSLIVSEGHTKHCAQYLVDKTDEGVGDFRAIPIQVDVGFMGCHIRRN